MGLLFEVEGEMHASMAKLELLVATHTHTHRLLLFIIGNTVLPALARASGASWPFYLSTAVCAV